MQHSVTCSFDCNVQSSTSCKASSHDTFVQCRDFSGIYEAQKNKFLIEIEVRKKANSRTAFKWLFKCLHLGFLQLFTPVEHWEIPKGMTRGCVRGGLGWISGKGSSVILWPDQRTKTVSKVKFCLGNSVLLLQFQIHLLTLLLGRHCLMPAVT